MTVSLVPLGKSGMVNKELTIVSNDALAPARTFRVLARVQHTAGKSTAAEFQKTIFGLRCGRCPRGAVGGR